MSEPERLTEDQIRAREALATLAAPSADPEFRAALKHAFVAGDFTRVERLDAHARGAHATAELAPLWARSRLAILRWAVAIPVAAAAAFVIVSLVNRGPGWALAASSGQGVAVVDGRPVPMNHVEDLSRLLTPGARVRIPDGCMVEIV